MSIALLVESTAPDLDGLPATYQTLIFGYNNEVQAWHRTSNGGKGRGQAWQKLESTHFLPTANLIHEPVATLLNERDLALVSMGLVTNIAVKALYANESANPITAPISHREAVEGLTGSLIVGDQTLANYLTDKRRTNEVVIEPIAENNLSGVTQKSATITEVAEVTPIVNEVKEIQEVRELSLSMDMITIPDPKWAKEYINRKFHGVTDWEIYDRALADNTNVLLEGGAGSGKTISVQSYASARGMRYFNVSNNNGIDPSQLFGQWIPTADGTYKWQDGAVTQLVRHGGVLLLNEVNFLPTRVSTVLFSLLDYRREIQLLENGGETIKAHPNLLVIADMNYGYKGTQELNQAFNDRFGIKLEFPYDNAIEQKLVGVKSLLTLADQLREQYEKEELSNPISTRSLVTLVKNAKTFGLAFAITSFVNGFNKEERGGVRLACDTHYENIAMEMGSKVISHPDMDDFNVEVGI